MAIRSITARFLRDLRRELARSCREHRGRLLLATLLILGAGAAVSVAGWQYANSASFCGSCHNMEPYVASWASSAHRDVACVDCHLEPGFWNHLKGKLQDGMLSAAYFLTGKSPSKPHALISSAACEECHPRESLDDRPLDFRGVPFAHPLHLGRLRNKMTLRCTTCHEQNSRNEHIAVTPGVCFQCHFYRSDDGDPWAQCTTCHPAPPAVLTVRGDSFPHGEYIARGIACRSCHKYVVEGNGKVDPARCVQCHNQTSRQLSSTNVELIHQQHVAEHKTECFVCHGAVEHRIEEQVAQTAGECSNCHPDAMHRSQHDLYLGTGGVGVADSPFKMYQTHIDCSSCHVRARDGRGSAFSSGFDFTVIETACVECHGPGFDRMLENWKVVLERAQNTTEGEVRAAERALSDAGATGAAPADRRRAEHLLGEARFNLSYVQLARGIHNVEYALDLLGAAGDRARQAGDLVTGTPSERTATSRPGCAELCHLNVNTLVKELATATFGHDVHVEDLELECAACHSPRWDHGKTVLQNCGECHHADQPLACANCHSEASDLFAGPGDGQPGERFSQNLGSAHSCEDCHTEIPEGGAASRDAMLGRCSECHDGEMAEQARRWASVGEVLLATVETRLETNRGLLRKADRLGIRVDRARRKLRQADEQVRRVRVARPVHNIQYSESLVHRANTLLDEVDRVLADKLPG